MVSWPLGGREVSRPCVLGVTSCPLLGYFPLWVVPFPLPVVAAASLPLNSFPDLEAVYFRPIGEEQSSPSLPAN